MLMVKRLLINIICDIAMVLEKKNKISTILLIKTINMNTNSNTRKL